MADLLGTAWWTVICLLVGVAAGVYLFPSIKGWFDKLRK